MAADRRLLDVDRENLPEAEQRDVPAPSAPGHERVVAAGVLLTGTSLIVGVIMALVGGAGALLAGGGLLAVIVAVAGTVLAATHWGWVHVAEYIAQSLDERVRRLTASEDLRWLAAVAPYPRFSVSTTVMSDASTRVQRFRHEPVLTGSGTFTFVRHADAEQSFPADAPAQEIAAAVETMRRRARLDTDRLRGNWEAAHDAYESTLLAAQDDQQRLAAQRAAALALSEHINASLLEPPLVE